MKNLLLLVLVLVVAIGAVGYWRGWFSVTSDFQRDKEAFSKTVSEKTSAMKDKIADLWKKTEGRKDADNAQLQKELGELKTKHERLEQQIKELDAAGKDKFDSLKQDLSKNLEEVETKIEQLKKKLEK